jgi:two-component system CheB/CheR fusion protein
LGRLLHGLPQEFPAPVLVVLHLDPNHRSQAVQLLQHRTRLRVQKARNGTPLQAGTVYVAPPDHHLEVHAGKIRLSQAPRVNYSRPSVDLLFTSVAADYGPTAIVAVLSGAGSDGAQGLAAVKARGGLAVAEDASTAAFSPMPLAAQRTGLLDAILPIDQIPAFLVRALARRITVSRRQWLRLLAMLEEHTGARFSGYRTSTLHRRLQLRLAASGCQTMAAYLRHLEGDASELDRLQSAFLIKFSSFLRDPPSWRALARGMEPLAARAHPVRAWSAGCATGEEAYSLALVLAHALGTGAGAAWKVFATDLDEGALQVGRAARYSDAHLRAVPKADLAKYFVREGTTWRVGKVLRERVVFGRHDLLRDPPLLGMEVLACRNVLIYFTPEEKRRVLRRLTVAVNPGGILFLGPSEGVAPVPGFDRLQHTTLFQRKGVATAMQDRKKATATDALAGRGAPAGPSGNSAIVALAVDAKGKVLMWNRAAEAFFGKSARQVTGKSLAAAVGKTTAAQLKAALGNKGVGQTSPVDCDSVDGPRRLNVECLPAAPPWAALFLGVDARHGAGKATRRDTPARPLRKPHLTPAAKLLAQQDLNDELQSRNEELETVNEELQSLNEEMSAMEEEMRGLGVESQRANNFLRLLLDSSPDVLIACDADNRVAFWSHAAIKRFRLSPEQAVGRDLFDIVPALDDAPLRSAARQVRASRKGGRIALKHGGEEFLFDPLPLEDGKRRSYLLRIRPGPVK